MKNPGTMTMRPWSMTLRLVGLQVLVSALLIGGALVSVLQVIAAHLDADNRDDLEHQVAFLRDWFEDPNASASAIMQQINASPSGHMTAQLYLIRMIDDRGEVLLETKSPGKLTAALFPAPGLPAYRWHVRGGPHYLLVSTWVHLGNSRQTAQLQVSFDVTDDATLLREVRQITSLVFAVTLLASAGLSLLITRRALRPLEALTRSAARIQASRLDARVDDTGWPAELVPLARELDAMLGRLDASFQRLGHFSSDLSHELRTPINNLRGEAEVALNRPRTAEEYRAVLESSLEEYARITRLIDTLLFIAKADQPEHAINRQSLDAAAECRAVTEYFEPASAERGVTLLVRGETMIHCDPVLFRRALANLVDNAIRHTPKDGHVDVTVRAGSNNGAEVEVTDTGAGIAPEHLPHVFQRFYQAGGKNTNPGGTATGFGLGLAIVNSIMELHQGRAEVASSPDRGTTVTLRFPGPVPPV